MLARGLGASCLDKGLPPLRNTHSYATCSKGTCMLAQSKRGTRERHVGSESCKLAHFHSPNGHNCWSASCSYSHASLQALLRNRFNLKRPLRERSRVHLVSIFTVDKRLGVHPAAHACAMARSYVPALIALAAVSALLGVAAEQQAGMLRVTLRKTEMLTTLGRPRPYLLGEQGLLGSSDQGQVTLKNFMDAQVRAGISKEGPGWRGGLVPGLWEEVTICARHVLSFACCQDR